MNTEISLFKRLSGVCKLLTSLYY